MLNIHYILLTKCGQLYLAAVSGQESCHCVIYGAAKYNGQQRIEYASCCK